jgi:hypothetical protein
MLLSAAIVVLAVVVYRVVTGGQPGPKTAAACALGVALFIGWLFMRRRDARDTVAPRT